MADQEKASGAGAKVQEVAANMQQAATRKRISGTKAEGIARRYFKAIDERDLDTAVSLWARAAVRTCGVAWTRWPPTGSGRSSAS